MKLQKIALLSMSVMIAAAALPGISNADNHPQCYKKEASVRLLLKKGHTSYLSLNSKGYPHRGVNATGSEAKEFR